MKSQHTGYKTVGHSCRLSVQQPADMETLSVCSGASWLALKLVSAVKHSALLLIRSNQKLEVHERLCVHLFFYVYMWSYTTTNLLCLKTSVEPHLTLK